MTTVTGASESAVLSDPIALGNGAIQSFQDRNHRCYTEVMKLLDPMTSGASDSNIAEPHLLRNNLYARFPERPARLEFALRRLQSTPLPPATPLYPEVSEFLSRP